MTEIICEFAAAYILLYLALTLFGNEADAIRLLISSAVWAAFVYLEPTLAGDNTLLAVIVTVISVLVAKKEYTFKEFLAIFTSYGLLKAAYWGAVAAIEEFAGEHFAGLAPFSVSGALFLLGIGVQAASVYLYERRRSKNFEYRVDFLNGAGAHGCKGWYDSGNTLYDDDGRPVIALSRKLSDKLRLPRCGVIPVMTVGGIKAMDAVEVEFRIYYGSGKNKLYRTRAVVSENVRRGTDVILHKDMGGENEFTQKT